MKQSFILLLLAVLTLPACRTTEANYRAAYDTAVKARDTAVLDSAVYAAMSREARHATIVAGGDTLTLTTVGVSIAADQGDNPPTAMSRYNVAVAQFRQLFHARDMRSRLVAAGFTDARVLQTREPVYYVVAAVADTPERLAEVMPRVKALTAVTVRRPYPLVLQPVRLSR